MWRRACSAPACDQCLLFCCKLGSACVQSILRTRWRRHRQASQDQPEGKSCRVPGTHQSDVHGKRRQEWMPWKACLGDTWARPVYDIFVACLGGGGRGMPFAAVHAHGLANPAGEATVPGQSNRPFPGQPDSATRSRGTPLVVTASWPAIARIKTVDVIGDVAACGIWFASGGGGGSQQGSARVVRRGRL